MQLKVILNRIEKQPGFVYGAARFVEQSGARPAIEVEIRERANGRAICGGCGQRARGYDRQSRRRFEFVPLWGITIYFVYALRRVQCVQCGVKTEAVPWASGKHRMTHSYQWFLARWARRLSWQEVARIYATSWTTVFRAVEAAVQWGRVRMRRDGISAIGVDEVQWQRGHRYLTVVYEISEGCRRLLWVGQNREERTLRQFFDWLGAGPSAQIKFVCSDMWPPYLTVIAERMGQALHVLDRFHIAARLSDAIDKVRAQEAKRMRDQGYEPVLKGARWCLLKRPDKQSDRQRSRLADLLQYNLRTVRAYLLKQQLDFFWQYNSPYWAGRFLDRWCSQAMRSRLEPMKKVARSLRAHRPLLLNWFRARKQMSSAAVEGLNNKLKLVTRRAYGFRSFRVVEIALYHTLGALPEPQGTHRFC